MFVCFFFLHFFSGFFPRPLITLTGVICLSSGFWLSQFPLNCFSCVLTLNFGALLIEGTTRPFPLPLKNAYFLLLFTSPSLSFYAAKAHEKSPILSLEAVLQFGCSSLCCLGVDVYLSRSCILRFLALIGLKKKERAAWREGFRVSYSLAHGRAFRFQGVASGRLGTSDVLHILLYSTWPDPSCTASLWTSCLKNHFKKKIIYSFLLYM